MIDIRFFQALLLVICVLGFVLSTLTAGGAIVMFRVQSPILRSIAKLAFVLLAVLSGVAGVLLVLLK